MQKIMFNDRYGLTQAVIDGRKTMTRRIVPKSLIDLWDEYVGDGGIHVHESERHFYRRTAPRYKVGEVVAVAQSYEQVYRQGNMDSDDAIIASLKYAPGMTNKMYIRADLMPHRIRITGIRCERVQDITAIECIKEGVTEEYINAETRSYSFFGIDGGYFGGGFFQPVDVAAKKAFALLLDKVSGRGTWERNPWVVVYEFELIK